MARRPRDYAKEERQRNALARERGFSSRAQQRNRIETGKFSALQPFRLSSPKTIEAQKPLILQELRENPVPNPKLWGVAMDIFTPSKTERNESWSDSFSRSDSANYDVDPDHLAELGVSKAEYNAAYIACFIDGDQTYDKCRYTGGSDAMEYWFVDLNGFMDIDEYRSRYKVAE